MGKIARRRLNTDIRGSEQRIVDRNENFIRYTNEIRHIKNYDKAQEREIIAEYQNSRGRKKDLLRNKIVLQHQRFILAIARKYGNGETVLDMVNEGTIGLIKALDKYDLKFENNFLVFAAFYIIREIQEFKFSKAGQIKLPNSLTAISRIGKTRSELLSRLEYDPTTDEIEEELEIKYGKNYHNILRVNQNIVRIDYQADEDEKRSYDTIEFDKKTSSINDYLFDEDKEYNKIMVNRCMTKLKERDKKIISDLFGLTDGEEKTIDEVAHRYNLTTERVRQIKIVSIKKMRQEFSR